MLLLNSNSYSKDDDKTDQWQCVINCATIIVDEEKEKNPFLGKWSPSFHCTVKQQAGAVDASTIEHARLIQPDLFFQKMENVVFIWKSRGAFLCVKQQAGAIDACIIEHAPLIQLDWSSPIEPLHSLFPNHNNLAKCLPKDWSFVADFATLC